MLDTRCQEFPQPAQFYLSITRISVKHAGNPPACAYSGNWPVTVVTDLAWPEWGPGRAYSTSDQYYWLTLGICCNTIAAEIKMVTILRTFPNFLLLLNNWILIQISLKCLSYVPINNTSSLILFGNGNGRNIYQSLHQRDNYCCNERNGSNCKQGSRQPADIYDSHRNFYDQS